MNISKQIPVIDLALLHQKSGAYQIAEILKTVYTTIGFAYLVNHGFPQNLVADAFKISAEFHALPLEEKMRIKQNRFFRGYMPRQGSTIKNSTLGAYKIPNQSAAFIMAHEVEETDPDFIAEINLAGPNQWPENMPELKTVLLAYQTEMLILSRQLLRAFALAFGLPAEGLDVYFTKPTTFLRLQYYPSDPDFVPENTFGLAPHTDYGFFTILAMDNNNGLQVRDNEHGWIDVPNIPRSFVLNTGDMVKLLTNGEFLSTPHRVINRSGNERFSIPFFFEPNMHAPMEVLEPFKDIHTNQNPSIKYCEHLMKRIRSNYKTINA